MGVTPLSDLAADLAADRRLRHDAAAVIAFPVRSGKTASGRDVQGAVGHR